MKMLLLSLLLLCSGCERYHVLAKSDEGLVYLKDNSTGKVYAVRGAWVHEVPLPP